MKNAMKKLTSLLLVAVLLVGAIPFGAMAAEDEISFAGGANEAAAASAEPAAEGTPAPVNEEEVIFSSGNDVAAASQTGTANDQVSIVLVIDACDGCGVNDATINTKAEPDAWLALVARDLLGMSNTAWTALNEKYAVTYSAEKISSAVSRYEITIEEKPVELEKFLVTVKIDGTNLSGDKELLEGTVLKLDASLLSDFGVAMPQGQVINMFKEVTYPNGTETIGDVISGSYTVEKAVEIRVITVPGTANNAGSNGSTNNGTNGSTGSTGSTGTQNTVGVKTVTFYNYDKSAVLHTAKTDANGKLAAIDVNYAAMLVKAPSGYVFSDRWTKNGTGDSIATSTIINELTFNADTFFVPVFTAEKTNIVTSTKNQNDIFLNIFVNKDFNHCKTVKLNDHWVISDNKITTAEILQYVVTDYYKASNGNLGLQCDGLYYSVGSFMYNWLLDNAAVKTDSIDGIDVKRANGTVTINVMVTNAVAKNGAAADKSNPKTGDSIYTAMTVMGISAASLAAVMYFYNKKRMAL